MEDSQSRVIDLFQKNSQDIVADMLNVQFEILDLFYVKGMSLV